MYIYKDLKNSTFKEDIENLTTTTQDLSNFNSSYSSAETQQNNQSNISQEEVSKKYKSTHIKFIERPKASEKDLNEREIYTLDDFKEAMKNVTKITKIEINWVEVKNNIALVCIDLYDTYDDEEKIFKDIIVSLIKENDEWKINFWP